MYCQYVSEGYCLIKIIIILLYRYNSGAKEFRPVHSRLFSIFIDALAIQDHYWDRKKK